MAPRPNVLPVKGAWAILAGLVLTLALSAPAAQAAATRAEYVAQAEPLCAATNQVLNKRAKKYIKQLKAFNREKPKTKAAKKRQALRFFFVSGTFYLTIGNALNTLDGQLGGIAAPAADATVAAQWLESLRLDADTFNRLGLAFKSRKLKKIIAAAPEANGLDKQLQATDAIVAGWGFQECLVGSDPSAPAL